MKLRSVDDIYAAHYNPRQTDPARLQYVKLSLAKLGYLLPIFVMDDGEIASGHQRHLATRALGWQEVPVVTLPPMDEQRRRQVNLVFNIATNDSDARTNAETMFERLEELHFAELLEALPDKQGDDRYPCLRARSIPVGDVVAANPGRWSEFQLEGARKLNAVGAFMPVVARHDLSIVNGLGRLQYAAEKGWAELPVVLVSDAEAALAEGLLNLLSMDFSLEAFTGDHLRHMAFRRASLKKQYFGSTIAMALGLAHGYQVDPALPESVALLQKRLGPRVLDFGSGRGEDAALLRGMGFDCINFEPFTPYADHDAVDVEASIASGKALLEAVAAGKVWTTIFMMSVLNSVPFHSDRLHVLTIVAALAADTTTVFSTAMGDRGKWSALTAADAEHNQANNRSAMFVLNYEPRTTMSLKGDKPKVQHYFTYDETLALFEPHFRQVTARRKHSLWFVQAKGPRAIRRAALRAALEFEFDLPLPGGRRLGLAQEAIRAFETRLNISL